MRLAQGLHGAVRPRAMHLASRLQQGFAPWWQKAPHHFADAAMAFGQFVRDFAALQDADSHGASRSAGAAPVHPGGNRPPASEACVSK